MIKIASLLNCNTKVKAFHRDIAYIFVATVIFATAIIFITIGHLFFLMGELFEKIGSPTNLFHTHCTSSNM